MSHTVAAVDLGASSGRVLVGTLEDGVLTVDECARFPNGAIGVPREGGEDLVWDIVCLWRGVRDGLAQAARRGPVDAVGIDTWAVDYGLLDSDGRLLGQPAAYRSARTAPAVEAVHAAADPRWLYERNGLQHQPFNTLFQLVADRGQARSELARGLVLIPDLLGYWLTGRQVCEVTNASTTGLVDPVTRGWSGDVIDLLRERFGVPVPGLLPPLVEPGAVIGPIGLSELQGQNGLRGRDGAATRLVAVGSHDTASAVVAVPAAPRAGETFAFISCGTWSLVGVELDDPVLTEASRAANFTNELGVDSTVRYLRNVMGMWVQQECLRTWREAGTERLGWDALNAETAAAEPLRTLVDIDDPRFLPPGDMPGRIDAAARAAGEPVPRDRGEYLRAIVESLALAYRRAIRQAEMLSGTRAGTVHIVGGGSQNALLCQLTADATGRPVIAGPVEGSAIGNMLVQLRAIGALRGGLDDLRVVVRNSVTTTRYEPAPGSGSAWNAAENRVPHHGQAPPAPTTIGH